MLPHLLDENPLLFKLPTLSDSFGEISQAAQPAGWWGENFWQAEALQAAGWWLATFHGTKLRRNYCFSEVSFLYVKTTELRSPVSWDSSLSSWKERSKLTDLIIYFTVLLLLTSDCMGSLTHWGFSLPTTANAIHFNLSRGQWYFFWENLNFGEIFLWQMILKKGFCKAAENSYEHK